MLWSELMMAALRTHGPVLRDTQNFVARVGTNGVRITAKDGHVTPQSRTVSQHTWEQLARMSDAQFDSSCVLDLGIGVFQTGDNLPRVLTKKPG